MESAARVNTPRSRDWRPLWDFADPAASEQRFREECERLEAAGQRDEAAECRTQIARALGLQRRFNEADQLLNDIERAGEWPDHVRVRVLLERGRVLNSSRRSDEARPFFERACDLASSIGEDDLAVDAAHMIAIVCAGEEAMEWNIKALAMAERSACPRARQWGGSLHNNLGWSLHALNRYGEALSHFEAAMAARVEQGAADEVLVARWCVARCLRSLGRLDEAFAIQRELRAVHEAAGSTDGYVCEELGECLLALGRSGEAATWFARAHAALAPDPWLAEREPQRLARLAQLGGADTRR
ncbi:MAG: tetratricopeptide repeat protein [Phycisphaerales bacterium]|nr:tetratricopeptide repeat protein [Phycisphaerales bacterium]